MKYFKYFLSGGVCKVVDKNLTPTYPNCFLKSVLKVKYEKVLTPVRNIQSQTVVMKPDLRNIWHLVSDLFEVTKQTLHAHVGKGVFPASNFYWFSVSHRSLSL